MSISFEVAINSLKTMFPEWDEETLSTLLVANNYHVERTIETVLSMSGDTSVNVPESAVVNQTASPSQSIDQPYPAPTSHSTPYPAPAPTPAKSRNRGAKCTLPDDFLRPPGHGNGYIIADEELALMLQNELFQREVRGVLGEGVLPASSSTSQSASNTPGRRASRGGSSNNAAAGSAEEGGVMRSLANMGAATKRSLSLLAQRFKGSGAAGGPGAASGRTESGNAREFRPLVGGDDEDETEVVTFGGGGGRGQHVLQGGRGGMADDDEGDSENPLIAQGGGVRNLSVGKKSN